VFTLTTINAWNRLPSRCVLRWASINRRRARCPKPLKTCGGSAAA